jgi:hypothetical protein
MLFAEACYAQWSSKDPPAPDGILSITKDMLLSPEAIEPIQPDHLTNIDYTTMPPAVFLLYFTKPVEIVKLQSFNISGMKNYVSTRPEPLVVTDPLMKGTSSGGVRFMISINDVISYYILKKR